MEKDVRDRLQRATQEARALLSAEFGEQLEGIYDILPDGRIPEEPGSHLDAAGRVLRRKVITTIEHKQAGGMTAEEAVQAFMREAAFTTLNRFVALKMLEARELVQECVSKGNESAGFREFAMLAPGLAELPDNGYRLYIESLFDEIGREVRVLFDRRELAGQLWPRRQALLDLLNILNRDALKAAWKDEEAIGWVYQYFNSQADRDKARYTEKGKRKAPQNSYELAVRNQFFTPDFVVRFLVDNALGRLWIEMRQGETRLTADCEYLAEFKNPVFLAEGERAPEANAADSPTEYVAFRAKKDPRDLRVLDPACGSGHFLLYAFELFETVYEEAWHDDASPRSATTGRTLRNDYDSLEALQRDLPRLILAHNLYGVDIDPRAAQIAGLALWMRAQSAWDRMGIARRERPVVTKSNMVTAEPMPGEQDLREEFLQALRPQALRSLVETVFERMELAGEAGTLLRIEEEIREAIAAAKRQWETKPKQLALMPDAEPDQSEQGDLLDVRNVSDAAFWDHIEGQVYEALDRYREKASAEGDVRRTLFVQDAVQGFAFLDLCRERYDAVLMNPPFGVPAEASKEYLDEQYPDSKGDILQAFVERGGELLVPGSYLGAITSRTPFFQSSGQDWRERVVLRLFRPQVLADFGLGVLDALVETAAYVLRNLTDEEDRAITLDLIPDLRRVETTKKGTFSVPKYMAARSESLKRPQAERELGRLVQASLVAEYPEGRWPSFTVRHDRVKAALNEPARLAPLLPFLCYRVLDDEDKAQALYDALHDLDDPRRYEADATTFADVPGAPFAYWVSDRARRLFDDLPPFESEGRLVKQGMATAKDFRFVRGWWEVPPEQVCPPDVHPDQWFGPYCVRNARWHTFAKGGKYRPYHADLHLLVNWQHDGAEIQNYVDPQTGKQKSRPQNTQYYFRPGMTWSLRTSRLCLQELNAGTTISVRGSGAYATPEELAPWLGLGNSTALDGLVKITLGREGHPQFDQGDLKTMPYPPLEEAGEDLARLGLEGLEIQRGRAASRETSLTASIPKLVAAALGAPVSSLQEVFEHAEAEQAAAEVRLAEVMAEADTLAYDAYGLTHDDLLSTAPTDDDIDEGEEEDGDDEADLALDPQNAAAQLLSYAVGCAFGRWDIRIGTGDRSLPELPAPFAPLPVCPPGMLQEPDGLPLAAPPGSYPLPFPEDGILVDDPGHDWDLVSRIGSALNILFPSVAEVEAEAASMLGESDLRAYFRKSGGFFDAHVGAYSRSSRKAPIYWPLSTPSGSYTVWLYYPRLHRDTLYRVLDLVREKVSHEQRRLRDLENEAGAEPSSSQRKALADQQDVVAELTVFRDEIEVVAPLWWPNLNDGVLLNFAPLHQLATLNGAWQSELSATWDALAAGDHEWSHLAMHLWPEVVVPQCSERLDLALAHGLVDVFFERQPDGSFQSLKEPKQTVEKVIAERTSQTVKAALAALTNAR